MFLYLVRHAVAGNADPAQWPDDRDRPLTPDGEKKFREVAAGLATLAPKVDVVLSSPLVRAWQTAQILQKHAGWPEPQKSVSSMALVGHAPGMQEFASYLLTGDPAAVPITLRKGGVICLQTEDGAPRARGAVLEWVARPRLLRSISR